ncbi:MAG: Rieske 2Fe-2S domain-containing protein [Deltaproteobacteria bacterium]|nr:Rieske 2Fe-2S domain-containing protein [Deltaproteobacteria bacterium]
MSNPAAKYEGEPQGGAWRRVCPAEDVAADGLYPFALPLGDLLHAPLLVVRRGDALYALHDECPHRRVKLSERAYLKGDLVVCGWHHWGFHLETGAHMLPTGICVPTYPLALRDGALWALLES